MARPTEAQVRQLAQAMQAMLQDERRNVHFRIGYVSGCLERLALVADGLVVEEETRVLEAGFASPPEPESGEEATPDTL